VAVVVFTVTLTFADKTTLSELVGTPLGFQLLALFQLVPSPPESHVFCANDVKENVVRKMANVIFKKAFIINFL
jgi:hypothetical protein